MIRRRSSPSVADVSLAKVPAPGSAPDAGLGGEETDGEVKAGKGRPTPKRSEVEKQRRQAARPPRDRKEAYRQQRERSRQERAARMEGLRRGDERALPARDRGPVRRFVRDFVDSKITIAEFFLPIAGAVVVASFIPVRAVQAGSIYVWLLMFVGIIVDSLFTGLRLRAELRKRFPGEDRKGAVLYGLLRSLQFRRFRLPAPQVRRGQRP